MAISHNLRHRRAVAAALRRSPEPQLGFSPTFRPNNPDPTDTPTRPDRPSRTDNDSTTISNDDLPTNSRTSATGTTTTGTTSATQTTATTPTTVQQFTTILPSTTAARPTTSSTLSRTTSTLVATSSIIDPSPTSSSPAAEDDSGMSTGAVVGGIGAGIVAIGVIGFGVAWAVRRARKRKQDGISPFDPTEFRKSAMLINEPTHQDTVDRGFNPPPPSMSEGRGGASFGGQYGGAPDAYGAYPNDNRAGYGSYGPSYGPGQTMPGPYGAPSPISPHSGNPMFTPHPYGQAPYSPGYNQPPFSPADQPSPMPEHYQGQYHPYNQPASPAPGPGGAYPVLTRQGSNGSQNGPNQEMQHGPVPADDYVDLNRSSVSPFQAAQYAEISRRLNTNVPNGRPSADLPPLPTKPNPFSDPSLPPTPAEPQFAIDNRPAEPENQADDRPSMEEGIPDFPAPPSPAHTISSRYRVDSSPPTLPEISVQPRVSYNVQNFEGQNGGPANGAAGPLSPLSTAGFTATASTFQPSPLASSFGAPTPAAQRTEFEPSAAAAPAAPPAAVQGQDAKKGRQSMYDADDAYGGI